MRARDFVVKSAKDMVNREHERNMKVNGILNTMFPPPSFNGAIRNCVGNESFDDVRSAECYIFAEAMSEIMVKAMSHRVGLEAIRPGVTGLPAGPNPKLDSTWRDIAKKHGIEDDLLASIENTGNNSSMIEILLNKYAEVNGSEEVNFHEEMLNDFYTMCPIVFDNMYSFFMNGNITLMNGNTVSAVWVHDRQGKVIYLERQMITYAEMIQYCAKLNLTIVSVHILFYFIDEYQDLDPAKVHILLMMKRDARMIAIRNNVTIPKFVFAGNEIQGIYVFLNSLDHAANFIAKAFDIPTTDILITMTSLRITKLACSKINEICSLYPEETLNGLGEPSVVTVPDDAIEGFLQEQCIEEEHPLPPAIECYNQPRNVTRLHTVAILSRNQKDVEALAANMLINLVDFKIRLPSSTRTTRSMLLGQLAFFKRSKINTVNKIKTFLVSKADVASHKKERVAFGKLTAAFEEWVTSCDDVIIAQFEGYVRGRFFCEPSIMLSTVHSVKGEEFYETRIYNIDQIPSAKAHQARDDRPEIFASEIHLMLVGLSRSTHRTLIMETVEHREKREEAQNGGSLDDENDESQDSQLSANLAELESGAIADAEGLIREREALKVLELPRTPDSLADLRSYTDQKRRMLPESADVDLFNASVRVIRRRMLSFGPDDVGQHPSLPCINGAASPEVLDDGMRLEDVPHAAANIEVPPGGENPVAAAEQQVQMAEQLLEAGAGRQLASGFEMEVNCVICNELIGTSGPVQALGCAHAFCRDCIGGYISSVHSREEVARCPICRRDIPEVEQNECLQGPC